ncbi:GQ67_03987T0 [Komagataella phaffii]|nr:GQ67_03987T0 [Komagataella phaffii]AOA69089.1 GQ68_03960T0 [Komagataella phaffii GS115]
MRLWAFLARYSCSARRKLQKGWSQGSYNLLFLNYLQVPIRTHDRVRSKKLYQNGWRGPKGWNFMKFPLRIPREETYSVWTGCFPLVSQERNTHNWAVHPYSAIQNRMRETEKKNDTRSIM